jgi:uncharacterized phosphosugar-binding protein
VIVDALIYFFLNVLTLQLYGKTYSFALLGALLLPSAPLLPRDLSLKALLYGSTCAATSTTQRQELLATFAAQQHKILPTTLTLLLVTEGTSALPVELPPAWSNHGASPPWN